MHNSRSQKKSTSDRLDAPTFVSFFTENGSYPFLAKVLESSLRHFELDYEIQKLSSDDSWKDTVLFKPRFILDQLLKHKKTIVWLDIDTEVWRFPEALFGSHEFAIYNFLADEDHHLSGKVEFNPKSEKLLCAGGVQKYQYTDACVSLLERWIDECETKTYNGDDPALDAAFNSMQTPPSALWLPKIYNRMDKHTYHWRKINPLEVVINHNYKAGGFRNG